MPTFFITGNPRSGKTWFAVRHMFQTYFTSKGKKGFELKKKCKDLTIISNINGLKLPHKSLEDVISQSGLSPQQFFSLDYQRKIAEKYPFTIYVIDECQFYFPFDFKEKTVLNWFQLHGQIGQDIFLITQQPEQVSKHIKALLEVEYRIVNKSANPLHRWLIFYKYLSAGVIQTTSFVFKSPYYFSLYTSEHSRSTEKIQNPFFKYLILILLCCIFGFFQVRKLIHRGENDKQNSSVTSTVKKSNKSNPSNQISSNLSTNNLVTIRLSHIVDNGIIYVFFGDNIYQLKNFPYKYSYGPFHILTAQIPENELPKSDDQKTDKQKNHSSPSESPATKRPA